MKTNGFVYLHWDVETADSGCFNMNTIIKLAGYSGIILSSPLLLKYYVGLELSSMYCRK